MAGKREADGSRDPKGSGASRLHRQERVDRRQHRSTQVRSELPGDDAVSQEHGASDRRDMATEPGVVVVGPGRVPNIFMPQDGKDLSIYRRMIEQGAIRPYELPAEMSRLAEHLMRMLDMAQASGRMRDAIKCIEIMRLLAADNRALAVEMDRIDRLDAGRPTAITGQVAPEVQERIKKIVATQRARVLNTESSNDGANRIGGESSDAERAAVNRLPAVSQADNRGNAGSGDLPSATDHRGRRAQEPQSGDEA